MRAFAQKPETPEQTTSTKRSITGREDSVQRSVANSRLHDFSRISVYPQAPLKLQMKLAANPPGDVDEQEADRVADQVITMPAPSSLNSAPPLRIQRFSGQSQSNGQMDAVPPSVYQALASPGKSLEPGLRQDMEQRFGHDFSRVWVHSGSAAAESAQELSARAYTVGPNIVFGAGQLSPGTREGRRLIAHELTHVVQHSGAGGMSVAVQRAPMTEAEVLRALREAQSDLQADIGVAQDFIEAQGGKPWKPSGLTPVKHQSQGKVVVERRPPGVRPQVSRNWLNRQLIEIAASGNPKARNVMDKLADSYARVRQAENNLTAARGGATPPPGPPAPPAPPAPPPPPSTSTTPESEPGVTPSEGKPKTGTTSEEEGPVTRPRFQKQAEVGAGPEFVPSALRFGASIAGQTLIGLLTDYIIGKIQEHFSRSAFEQHLRELQPEIEKRKNEAIEQSPPEIRQLIEHPVVGESRQFYWVIQLRIRTTQTFAPNISIPPSIIPELVSVTVSEKETKNVGAVQMVGSVVAPITATYQRQDSQTVTYSQPIVSWSAVYPAGVVEHLRQAGFDKAEPINVLRFASNGKEVTTESLFAWAKANYPRLLADPALEANIMNSHEFDGSQAVRERAVRELERRVFLEFG